MKTVTFLNFTDKDFTWDWDKEPFTFKAGQSVRMESRQAKHFAKHLTNQILNEKGLENYTSPKFPEQEPKFFEIFNKIIINEGQEIAESKVSMEVLNNNMNSDLKIDKPFCEFCDAKGPEHKKSCTRNLVKDEKPEEEFEDLEKLEE